MPLFPKQRCPSGDAAQAKLGWNCGNNRVITAPLSKRKLILFARNHFPDSTLCCYSLFTCSRFLQLVRLQQLASFNQHLTNHAIRHWKVNCRSVNRSLISERERNYFLYRISSLFFCCNVHSKLGTIFLQYFFKGIVQVCWWILTLPRVYPGLNSTETLIRRCIHFHRKTGVCVAAASPNIPWAEARDICSPRAMARCCQQQKFCGKERHKDCFQSGSSHTTQCSLLLSTYIYRLLLGYPLQWAGRNPSTYSYNFRGK